MQHLFTSDLHLGHANICKYRPQFSSAEDHDELIFDKLAALPKRTLVTVVGDCLFNNPKLDTYLRRLEQLRCKLRIVMGNHDSLKLYKSNLHIELPLFSYKNKWVSHAPIHSAELRNRLGNIHGHLHLETLPDPRYFNVNIDVHNYQFVPYEIIHEHFNALALT